jgi:LuxR family maltose regulon positive regulatory protein
MQAPNHTVAWLSLDAGDTEPALFWRYVATAINQACPGVGRAALAQLDSGGEASLAGVVAALANGMASTPVHLLLVLDDYHTITTPPIHETLQLLIERLPVHTRVAIASRTRLPLALARLTILGQVTTFTAEELRFTTLEMREFFARACALPLSTEVIATLDALLAGWAAGLQLAAMSLRQATDRSDSGHAAAVQEVVRSFIQGSAELVSAYLLEEVFSQQTPALQEVLLRTGCLDLVCPSLCAAVIDTSVAATNSPVSKAQKHVDESQAVLDQLVDNQLLLTPLDEPVTPDSFVVRTLERRLPQELLGATYLTKQQVGRSEPWNLAPQHAWYRYHPLFAEFLRNRLQRTDPKLFSEVQRRAAVWHAQQGFVRSAIAHAMAANDIPFATELIEQHAEATYQRGELVTLRHWLEALPDETIIQRPLLCLLHANILAVAADFSSAGARLDEAARALGWSRSTSAADAPTRLLAARILAARAELIYMQRDRSRSLAVYRQALSLLPEDEREHRLEILANLAEALVGTRRLTDCIAISEQVVDLSRTRGNLPRLMNALYDLGHYRRLQGSLPAAVECFREALFLAKEREEAFPRPVSLAHMGLGRVLYEWNELEAARRHMLRALELNTMGSSAGLHIRCHSALAFICEAEGNLSAARSHLELIAEHRQMTPHRQGLKWAGETSAQFWLRHGETGAAVAWVQQLGVTVETAVTPEVDDGMLMLARLLLATSKAQESLVILQRVRAGPEQQNYIDDVIPIMVVQAQVFQALGATSEAVSTLAHALALAEAGGYVRTFLDEGPVLLPLLRAVGRTAAKRLHAHASGSPWPSAAYVQHVASQVPAKHSSRVTATATLPPGPRLSLPDSLFTVREWDIIEHLLAGRSNQEIARALVVTQSTVKWHLGNIYSKLNACNLAEALLQLYRMGVVAAHQPDRN